jgi:multidrug efflux pump subunit AcrA (membrane-fusion protein)
LFDEHALLGLELDQVLLGADPAPRLSGPETKYQRWARQQKEKRAAAARDQAAWAEQFARQKAEEAEWLAGAEKRLAAETARRAEREAQQKAAAAERAAKREALQQAELLSREQALTMRWSSLAVERSAFEGLFAVEFLEGERQRGMVFDLCSLCRRPFWIQYNNLVNWVLYWKGPPRCFFCFCPPLADRACRENPAWSAARISHEIVSAIRGSGSYAWAPELVTSRAWWTMHEHEYEEIEETSADFSEVP